MQGRRVALLLRCLLFAAATVAGAAPASDTVQPGNAITGMAPFLQAATGSTGYLGAVSFVMRASETLDFQAAGYSDLARQKPMQRDSIFRIYSMSKTVATVAALILVDEGKLRLDDPVARFLPEFEHIRVFEGGTADAPRRRAPLRPITIRHLLTHTAGFGTGGSGSVGIEQASRMLRRADPQGAADLKGYANRVSRVPLAIDPGLRFGYDGVQIEVLGRVLEVVSGMPLDALMQQRVFNPLQMADTGFSVPQAQRHRIVDMTTMGLNGSLELARGPSVETPGVMLNPYPSGAGGLYSTAPDFARFCQMLLNGGTLDGVVILRPESVAQMSINQLALMDPPPFVPARQLAVGEGFGLGGAVLLDVPQRERPGAPGALAWSGASSTYFSVDSRQQLIAILLLQHLPGDNPMELPKLKIPFYKLVYQSVFP